LRYLWQYHGAPKLDEIVSRFPGLRPRNVTATDKERQAIMTAAPPHLRLWLLFCADLAIRSGTAARIDPSHYDANRRELRFTTKYGEHLTLPCTAEIVALINQCDPHSDYPFVRQLWAEDARHRWGRKPKLDPNDPSPLSKQFCTLRRSLGITRKLTPHDLRRTAAVHMLEATGDLRDVQALLGHRNLTSTLWYLDHDMRPVSRSVLERIKRPAWREQEEMTA